jgi:hypothetical protein
MDDIRIWRVSGFGYSEVSQVERSDVEFDTGEMFLVELTDYEELQKQLHDLQDIIRYLAIDIGKLNGRNPSKESIEFCEKILDKSHDYLGITYEAIEQSRERAKQ